MTEEYLVHSESKIKPDLDWQLETWKMASVMDCWKTKWSKQLGGWVSRSKEPCVNCERPTCASKGLTKKQRGYDGSRTYFLDLIENESYVHMEYQKRVKSK